MIMNWTRINSMYVAILVGKVMQCCFLTLWCGEGWPLSQGHTVSNRIPLWGSGSCAGEKRRQRLIASCHDKSNSSWSQPINCPGCSSKGAHMMYTWVTMKLTVLRWLILADWKQPTNPNNPANDDGIVLHKEFESSDILGQRKCAKEVNLICDFIHLFISTKFWLSWISHRNTSHHFSSIMNSILQTLAHQNDILEWMLKYSPVLQTSQKVCTGLVLLTFIFSIQFKFFLSSGRKKLWYWINSRDSLLKHCLTSWIGHIRGM